MNKINLLAGGPTGGDARGFTNPLFSSKLEDLLQNQTPTSFFRLFIAQLIDIFLIGGSITFMFMLIVGAIQWISSGGDKAGLESAKSKVSHALIGIFILFSVYAILNLLETFFSISLTNFDFAFPFID